MCLGSSARKPRPLPVLRGWPRVSVPRTPFPLQPWLSRKMKKMERGRREVEGERRSLCSAPTQRTHILPRAAPPRARVCVGRGRCPLLGCRRLSPHPPRQAQLVSH